ncbi:hypothetical protein [Ruminococcus sp.]|uniref:hypothetical protein n=1 Tax=Ruminococcus sp. TaxID=41978 RepID=UPI001B4DB2CE|nr:hypothetical protein [Ruminococcus sp.]MBP5433485.1 hypothetical protein [Ruminococcus sp.]
MLPVTGNVNAMPRKLSCKLEIGGNTITEVKQLTYAQDWSGDISIGNVVSSYFTATIPTPSFSLTGGNVTLSMGIGSSVEWVAIGQFAVDPSSVRTKQGYTSFSAYDKLHDSVNSYVPNSSYAETLQGLCDDVCNQIGITSASLGVSLSLAKVDLAGYTLRDVLGFIAAYCGKNAYLNASGGLALKYFSNASYTADGTRANVPYIGENNCTVGRLICQSADGVLTAGSGEGIYFTCPFMTQARLNSLQSALGITYRKADVDIPYGNFCLQSGDIITVTTTGSNLTVPIMANSWTYDGGLSSSVSAYGVSDYSGFANNAERSISFKRFEATAAEKKYVGSAVQEATADITGANGGIIRINMGGNGKPAEILILDTGDISTASSVFRLNENGLGYSSNGYNGPYDTAITAAGLIVTDRFVGNKISGVTIESNPSTTGGQKPYVKVENGAISFYQVTVNGSGEVTSSTYIGEIRFEPADQYQGDAVKVDIDSGNSFSIGVAGHAPDFVYYSDPSQAPSGAEMFNIDGNLRFYSSTAADYFDLATMEEEIEDLKRRVTALGG